MSRTISLAADQPSGVTVISNRFIDHYLPQANGEFVKIYIYLLRWLSTRKHRPFAIECIADTLNMTENDVIRALKYWEQRDLLELTWEEGELSGIRLLLSVLCPVDEAEKPEAQIPEAKETQTVSEAPARTPEEPKAEMPTYSMQEISSFQQGPEGQDLLFIIEQYLGHTLSASDLNTIYYFHEGLGFSAELIEYLFEYCLSGGHTHMRYIEKVALGWSEQHISTPEEAKNCSEAYSQTVFPVMKAFGLGSRMPSPGEAAMVTKWSETYGFDQELILEAVNRTMMKVHSPSFDYTDRILLNWMNAGIRTMADVAAADRSFSDQKAAKAQEMKAPQKAKPAGNRFHNFHQRSYDYGELEKKLSQKLQQSAGSSDQ